MPSDPAFLLLASDAFTDTLGYGSFEQFIRNSFYLEASLSDNKTVYMHLGQSGLISDFGETGNIELPFDEVTKSMVFSQVIEDDNLIACIQKFHTGVAADETGTAGD